MSPTLITPTCSLSLFVSVLNIQIIATLWHSLATILTHLYLGGGVLCFGSWVTLMDFTSSRLHIPENSLMIKVILSVEVSQVAVVTQLSFAGHRWLDQGYSLSSFSESHMHYVTTWDKFNCCWQDLQKDYSMIWHWNEHLLCSHEGLETTQQGANLVLVKQISVIGENGYNSIFSCNATIECFMGANQGW